MSSAVTPEDQHLLTQRRGHVNIRLTGVHRYCLRGPVPGVANIALGGQQ